MEVVWKLSSRGIEISFVPGPTADREYSVLSWEAFGTLLENEFKELAKLIPPMQMLGQTEKTGG